MTRVIFNGVEANHPPTELVEVRYSPHSRHFRRHTANELPFGSIFVCTACGRYFLIQFNEEDLSPQRISKLNAKVRLWWRARSES